MTNAAKKSALKLPKITPRIAHDSDRALRLSGAVSDYHVVNKRCPDEWLKELIDLNKTFAK